MKTNNTSLIQQLNPLDTALATLQTQLNQHTYQLYNLTQDEIVLIEGA